MAAQEWVYFLRHKSRAFEFFKKFKAMTELQSVYKVKWLKSDKGGEFMSNVFVEFCNSTKVQRQLTMFYTPQPNVVAERKNRTVVEMAKAMLHEKCMTYQFYLKHHILLSIC